MSGYVIMGLLIGGAIIIATAMWIYFSPFQTCIRTLVEESRGGMSRNQAVLTCSDNH